MAEQRSVFRIRRLRPSVQPPRPTPADTRTPARKPPVRPRPNPPPRPIPSQDTTTAPPQAPTLAIVPSPTTDRTPPLLPIRSREKPLETPLAPPLPIVPSPTRARGPLPQEAPAPSPSPPIRHLGTVPAQPPSPPQDERASMAPPPLQAPPPSSLSQTGNQSRVSSHPLLPSRIPTQPLVSTKPQSPSTTSPPTSPTSSPTHLHPSQTPSPPTSPQLKKENTPEVKKSTEIPSNNVQKGNDYALDAKLGEERHEQTSREVSSEHSNSESHINEQPRIRTRKTKVKQHKNEEPISTTSNIPNTTQTRSMISHPDDKNLGPESPEYPESNGSNQVLSEKHACVITFAGDNRGTSMHISSGTTKREKPIHIYRRYKVNPEETTDTTTDGEEKESESEANENHEKNSYINCNIQGINNSMVFNCSFTERNPRVHLGSCNPENLQKPKRKHIKSTDLSKVKVNITPSQKHTVRRRCLGGLFMESSDSDPNDPQKPRRHGCRYIFEDKTNKEDNRDVI